ncbi:hypothetical protein CWO91_14395 [Bradyrhizobium genosp. SA-3]|nr:hypothetical protein CWO91_14395 [Bradyrhizobium genosp. SA-3]
MPDRLDNRSLGVWVPAFAGTTLEGGATASITIVVLDQRAERALIQDPLHYHRAQFGEGWWLPVRFNDYSLG